MKGRVLKVSIVVLWLAAMAALVGRHYLPAGVPDSGASELPAFMFEEQWAGIYRSGEKIGYSMSRLERTDGGFTAREEALMRVRMLGAEKEIAMTTQARLDADFRLKAFDLDVESDLSMHISGVVEGDNLQVTVDTGQPSRMTVPLKEAPYMNVSLAPLLGSRGMEVGDAIRLPMLDPSSMAQDHMELRAVGRERITVMGAEREAFRLEGAFKGMRMLIWASEDGEILRQEAAGMIFVRETREEALRLDRPSVDLIADMAVPFNLDLPKDISYLKARVEGIDPGDFELDGGNQRLRGNVLEVRKSVPAEGEAQPPRIEQYLAGTIFVESGDPAIVALAGEITGRETDTLGKARLIFDWVHGNIEKAPVISIPRATAVLKARKGDCNEHTVLYAALARASGVPTRIAVGLVYDRGSFYYHAWPEVYSGGWTAVDPTLGQWPADATHIRLLTGGLENQLRLASALGNIRLVGLEYGE